MVLSKAYENYNTGRDFLAGLYRYTDLLVQNFSALSCDHTAS